MASTPPACTKGRRHRCAGWLLLALALPLVLPVMAQPQRWQPAEPQQPGLSLTQEWSEPRTRQTMLWTQGQRWALGLGIEQRVRIDELLRRPGLPPAQDAALLLGMALNTGESTQLTVQLPLLGGTAQRLDPYADPLLAQEQRQLRMGLVFRSDS